MAKLFWAMIVFALVILVVKVVFVAILLVGLIFRPKVTIGLLIVGGWLVLTESHPIVGVLLLVAFMIAAVAASKRRTSALPAPTPTD